MAYGLLLPALIWMALMLFFPSLKAILDSFSDLGLTGQGGAVGLGNYVRLWQDPKFWGSLLRSLQLTGLAVLLEAALGLGLALVLRQPLRGMAVCRGLLLVGWVISTVSQVILFEQLFDPNDGYVNLGLQAMGLGAWRRNWFADPQLAFGMVVMLHVWRNTPFFAINFLAGMLAIPKEFCEAARLDGAGSWKLLLHVTLPQLRWIGLTLVFGHLVFTFTDYTLVKVSTGGGSLDTTEVLPLYLYNQAWNYHDVGVASALGVVMLAILFACTALLMRNQWKEMR